MVLLVYLFNGICSIITYAYENFRRRGYCELSVTALIGLVTLIIDLLTSK